MYLNDASPFAFGFSVTLYSFRTHLAYTVTPPSGILSKLYLVLHWSSAYHPRNT